MKTPLAAVLVGVLSVIGSAQTETTSSEAARSYAEFRSDTSKAPRTRIVDATSVRQRPNPIVRGIQAPFQWLGEKSEAGMARFEKDRWLNRGLAILGVEVIPPPNHKHLHSALFFGSVSENSGFGIGGSTSTAELISKNFQLNAVAAFTTKKYLSTSAGLTFKAIGQKDKALKVDLTGRYETRPQEEFSGVGPDSFRGSISTYEVQERGVSAIGSVNAHRRLVFGGGVDVSSFSVGYGKADDLPNALRTFGAADLVGSAGTEFIAPLAFVEFDARDSQKNARKGAYARFGYRFNKTLGGSEYDHDRYEADFRGYVPLGTRRRILAVRMLGEFNDPRARAEVPFYLLARAGGTSVLRGFDPQRFYGRNLLMSSLEYRFDLTRQFGTFLFTDVGQVFNSRQQLTRNNIQGTFGGGFEIKSENAVFARVFAARTSEATRLMVRLGAGF